VSDQLVAGDTVDIALVTRTDVAVATRHQNHTRTWAFALISTAREPPILTVSSAMAGRMQGRQALRQLRNNPSIRILSFHTFHSYFPCVDGFSACFPQRSMCQLADTSIAK